MTQHIIDTDELEKLQKFVMLDMTNGVEQCTHGDYVHIDDFRKLIANSPQADGMVPDVLFDGYTVFNALSEKAKARTSAENVSDVLDAVVKIMRSQSYKPQADGMVLVPSEPTAEMRHAFRVKQIDYPNSPRVLYKAMLSAYKPQADEKEKL